jgi:hypothetical protein
MRFVIFITSSSFLFTPGLFAQLASQIQFGGIASTTLWAPGETATTFSGGSTTTTFNNRFVFLLNVDVDEDISAFVSLESWQGRTPRFYGIGLNWRVLKKPVFIIRAGRFLAPFGNFLHRRFDSTNPLIGRPVAYIYRHNLSASILPQSTDDLLSNRGEGDAFSYSGTLTQTRGMRLFWLETYLTGVQFLGESGKWRYSLAVTNGSLSNTSNVNNSEAFNFSGRLLFSPIIGLKIGGSFSSGAYLNDRQVQPALAGSGKKSADFRQKTFGGDLTYSFGHLEFWGEFLHNSYASPFLDDLKALAWSAEGKYKFSARLFLAARYSALLFDEIDDANDVDGDGVLGESWDYNVSTFEAGLGYRIHRNGYAKITHQFNRTHDTQTGDPADDVTAFQLVVFF